MPTGNYYFENWGIISVVKNFQESFNRVGYDMNRKNNL